MSTLTALPLEQLVRRCRPLHQDLTVAEQATWRELQRRACAEGNDAAWDLLVQQIWPTVLFWIYQAWPDTSPAEAEWIAQQVIQQLRLDPQNSNPAINGSRVEGTPFLAEQLRSTLYKKDINK